MAKQNRKPANRKPITSNPLFPAVVALWFGALFGLGSLAVRPSLIENLVLSSRLDLVVPAAAPPLGITARIMVALVLAALGALIGAALARRFTRPKVEAKERSRGARDLATPRQNARDAHPDAPACKPISIRDLGDEAEAAVTEPADKSQPVRRRGLTADHGEEEFVPHDFAPLPGGAPQILDLGARGPALPPVAAVPEAQVSLSPTLAVQALPQAEPAADPARQVFHAQTAAADVALSPDSAAAHADGRQVFGMDQVQPQQEQPRQIFGAAVDGDHVSQDFVREAGYRTTVFDTETAPPLFDREPASAMAPAVPVAEVAPMTVQEIPAMPAATAPVSFAPQPVQAAPAPIPAPAMVPQPAPEPLPAPGSLGMTDLASRLAESMRRRRAAKAGAAVAAPVVPEVAAPTIEAATAPAPQFAPEAGFAHAPATQFGPETASPVAAEPVLPPVPAQFEAPAAFTAPAVNPIPSAYEPPMDLSVAAEQTAVPGPVIAPEMAQALPVAPAVPAAPMELPSALRPLALDAFLEDDTALDPAVLPPRQIAMPAAIPPAAPPAQPLAHEDPRSPEPTEVAEEPIAEENYASLLGIAQTRGGFVRIEEPEADSSAPEPVVIFPGQGAFGGGGTAAPVPSAAPLEPIGADGGQFRRFDGPEAAGLGQPIAADNQTAPVDSAAADQALRSALASLQRISGAA